MKYLSVVALATSFLCVGCASKYAVTQDAAVVAKKEAESVEVSKELFKQCSVYPEPFITGKTPDDIKSALLRLTAMYVNCASYYEAQSRVIQKAFKLDSDGNPLK